MLQASAKGLIFMWQTRIGAGISYTHGHGFAIGWIPDVGWSPPVWLNLNRAGVGAILGAENINTLMVTVTQHAVMDIAEESHRAFGSEISFKLWPLYEGTEDILDVARTNFSADWIVASHGNGIMFDFSISGGVLSVDHKKNERLYGKGTTAGDILTGRVPRVFELKVLYSRIASIARQISK